MEEPSRAESVAGEPRREGGGLALVVAAERLHENRPRATVHLVGTVWEEFNIRGAVMAAQYVGKGDQQAVRRVVKQSYSSSLMVACLATALVTLFNGAVIKLALGNAAGAEMISAARTYLMITCISYPFYCFYSNTTQVLRGVGEPRKAMYMSVLMNLSNFALSLLFIYGFRLGIQGAALASLLGRVIGTLLGLLLVSRTGICTRLSDFFTFKLDLATQKTMIRLGVPTGMQSFFFVGARLVMNRFILDNGGAMHLSANVVFTQILDLQCTGSTFVIGMAPAIMGMAKGRGDQEGMVRLMVGRSVDTLFPRETPTLGETVLEVEGLSRDGVLKDINFDVRKGEILGFSGLVGSGRSNVVRCLFGLEPFQKGTIRIKGREARIRRPSVALEKGLFLVPEDRKTQGLFLNRSVEDNVTVLQLLRRLYGLFLVKGGLRRREALRLTEELNVRFADLDHEVQSLSGGNQQKVVIAKGLSVTPEILILDEPTRGIDVGAKAEIHHLMNRLTHEGMAVIMVSSELPEVLGMSDRVAVMREGRIAAFFDKEEATSEKIMLAAAGGVEVGAP